MSGNNGNEFDAEATAASATAVPTAEPQAPVDEFSDTAMNTSGTEDGRKTTDGIVQRYRKLREDREKKENKAASQPIDEMVKEEFESQENVIRTVLAKLVVAERRQREDTVKEKERVINRNPIRIVLDPVASLFGYSTKVKLSANIDEDEMLDTVIQKYLGKNRSNTKKLERDLVNTRDQKGVYVEKVDLHTNEQRERFNIYNDAQSRVDGLNNEIEKMKADKYNLQQQRSAEEYDGTSLEKPYHKLLGMFEQKQAERKELNGVQQRIKKEMSDIHKKLVRAKDRQKLYEGTEEVIEEQICDLRTISETLGEYKEQQKEKTAVIDIYTRLAETMTDINIGNQVNELYEKGLAKMVDAIKSERQKVNSPDSGAMADELRDAFEEKSEADQSTQADIIEVYRGLFEQ
jgi:hypothetical protein